MDKEIKIFISKRTLTYYTISVVIVLLSFFLGYAIRGASATKPAQATPVTINRSNNSIIAEVSTDQFQTINTEQIKEAGGSEAETPALSDASWRLKSPEAPTAEIPQEESVRYYSSNSQTTTGGSPASTNSEFDTASTFNKYVASKNGTKYYPIDCKSADRIKEENRIYFSSAEEAELEGLSRTTTCK